MQILTANHAHQQAVRWTASMWQSERAEVFFSALLGQIPQEQNGSPVYVMYVAGTAQDGFGENYFIDQIVAVRLTKNGQPIVRPALDWEVWQAEGQWRGETCVEYGC